MTSVGTAEIRSEIVFLPQAVLLFKTFISQNMNHLSLWWMDDVSVPLILCILFFEASRGHDLFFQPLGEVILPEVERVKGQTPDAITGLSRTAHDPDDWKVSAPPRLQISAEKQQLHQKPNGHGAV